MQKTLIVIAGPTASGKTELAITLAQKLKTEILSADGRQFYREMNIGTAKPSLEELKSVPHHFINNLSIHNHYTVGDYEQEALMLLNDLFKKHDYVIMVGGSGLYIKAVTEGLDQLPNKDESIRKKLQDLLQKEGISALQTILKELDADAFKWADINNPQRLIRYIELCQLTGKKLHELYSHKTKQRNFKVLSFAIDLDRNTLYERINNRVDKMIDMGLVAEAQNLYPLRHLNALQTVGYKELFDFFENKITLTQATELIKQHTRQYAKRQMTWFRNNGNYQWIDKNELLNLF